MSSDATKLLYKTIIVNYLTIHLKRKPTDEEILAEAKRCGAEHMINSKPTTYEEFIDNCAKAWGPREANGPNTDYKADMIEHGYWPKESDE